MAKLEYKRQRKRKKITKTVVGQWSILNINAAGHEERVAQTGVCQRPGWNMDGKENEEKFPRLQLLSGRAGISTALYMKKELRK